MVRSVVFHLTLKHSVEHQRFKACCQRQSVHPKDVFAISRKDKLHGVTLRRVRVSQRKSRGPMLLLLLMLANVISCQRGWGVGGLPACRPPQQAAARLHLHFGKTLPWSRRSDDALGRDATFAPAGPFGEWKTVGHA